jgi:hypothetical protein
MRTTIKIPEEWGKPIMLIKNVTEKGFATLFEGGIYYQYDGESNWIEFKRTKEKEKMYSPFISLAKKWLGSDYCGNPRCDKEQCGNDLLDLVEKEMEKS